MPAATNILATIPRKFLVVQLKRIGDLILTTPVLHVLRERFPQSEVILLAGATSEGLLPLMPATRSFAYGRPGFWGGVFQGADVCLDFTGTDRSALISALSRAPCRVTYGKLSKKIPHRFAYSDFVDSNVQARHTADYHTDLLQVLGIVCENQPLQLNLVDSPVFAPTNPYAVIHPGTARQEKYWNPESWAKVAVALFKLWNLEIVLTGSTDAHETEHLAVIQNLLPTGIPVINLAGTTGLASLSSVIGGAEIFCGVDTAAMHLADAMRTPCVALFGPTNPFHWRPRHTANIVLRSETSEPFAPKQKGGPMSSISPDAVISAITEILSRDLKSQRR